LWVLRDEAGLRRVAVRLLAAGALGAVVLAGLASRAAWLSSTAAHWPVLLAAGAWLLVVVPSATAAVAGRTAGRIGWRGLITSGLVLAIAAGVAATRWPAVMPVALDQQLALAALGAVTGLALVPGLLPRFVAMRPPLLWWEARGAPADPADALATRALALWPRIERADPAPEVRRALAAALARQLVAARRWRQLAPEGMVPAAAALAAEQERLAHCQAGSQDPVARIRYADARRSLDLQAQHLATIAAARERLRAQLHRQLEAMEALHLASLTARTAAADRGHGDGDADVDDGWRPQLDELARLGDELDAARELDAAGERDAQRGTTEPGDRPLLQ
jgi:hypothetical protein